VSGPGLSRGRANPRLTHPCGSPVACRGIEISGGFGTPHLPGDLRPRYGQSPGRRSKLRASKTGWRGVDWKGRYGCFREKLPPPLWPRRSTSSWIAQRVAGDAPAPGWGPDPAGSLGGFRGDQTLTHVGRFGRGRADGGMGDSRALAGASIGWASGWSSFRDQITRTARRAHPELSASIFASCPVRPFDGTALRPSSSEIVKACASMIVAVAPFGDRCPDRGQGRSAAGGQAGEGRCFTEWWGRVDEIVEADGNSNNTKWLQNFTCIRAAHARATSSRKPRGCWCCQLGPSYFCWIGKGLITGGHHSPLLGVDDVSLTQPCPFLPVSSKGLQGAYGDEPHLRGSRRHSHACRQFCWIGIRRAAGGRSGGLA
jgi:hypothetical protein